MENNRKCARITTTEFGNLILGLNVKNCLEANSVYDIELVLGVLTIKKVGAYSVEKGTEGYGLTPNELIENNIPFALTKEERKFNDR